jgi:hypothetical protein
LARSFGSDIKLLNHESTLGFVSVGVKTTWEDFLQARGRLRGIDAKQRLNLVIAPELRSILEKDGAITVDRVVQYLIQNQVESVEMFNFSSLGQQIRNVLRSNLLAHVVKEGIRREKSFFSEWFARTRTMFDQYEKELLMDVETDPAVLYAPLQAGRNPKDVLLDMVALEKRKLQWYGDSIGKKLQEEAEKKLDALQIFIEGLEPDEFTLGDTILASGAGIGSECEVDVDLELEVESEVETDTQVHMSHNKNPLSPRHQFTWGEDLDIFNTCGWFQSSISIGRRILQKAIHASPTVKDVYEAIVRLMQIARITIFAYAMLAIVAFMARSLVSLFFKVIGGITGFYYVFSILFSAISFLFSCVAYICLSYTFMVQMQKVYNFVHEKINKIHNTLAKALPYVFDYGVFPSCYKVPIMSVQDVFLSTMRNRSAHKLFETLQVTANFWDASNERIFSRESPFLSAIASVFPSMDMLELDGESFGFFTNEQKPFNQLLVIDSRTFFGGRKTSVILIDTKEAQFFAKKIAEEKQLGKPCANHVALYDLASHSFSAKSSGFNEIAMKQDLVFQNSRCEALFIQAVLKRSWDVFDDDHMIQMAKEKIARVGRSSVEELARRNHKFTFKNSMLDQEGFNQKMQNPLLMPSRRTPSKREKRLFTPLANPKRTWKGWFYGKKIEHICIQDILEGYADLESAEDGIREKFPTIEWSKVQEAAGKDLLWVQKYFGFTNKKALTGHFNTLTHELQ